MSYIEDSSFETVATATDDDAPARTDPVPVSIELADGHAYEKHTLVSSRQELPVSLIQGAPSVDLATMSVKDIAAIHQRI